MDGRAPEVGGAEVRGSEHLLDDGDVSGLGTVGGGRESGSRTCQLRAEGERGPRLERFEARAREHGGVRGAQAEEFRAVGADDDGGSDVARLDESAAFDDGEAGRLGGREGGETHALKRTTL